MDNNFFVKNDELKKEIDSFRPLSIDALSQIKEYYKIGLTYSSNALEGNTLDLAETKVVIEDGLTIGGKPLKDHFEALGHAKAYDKLLELAKKDNFDENDIKLLHKLFYSNIDDAQAGEYRKTQVIITGSDVEFPKPDELDSKMRDFVSKLYELKSNLHPIEYAAMVHILFVNIHPFIDGNGVFENASGHVDVVKNYNWGSQGRTNYSHKYYKITTGENKPEIFCKAYVIR